MRGIFVMEKSPFHNHLDMVLVYYLAFLLGLRL